jgi:hypothetical protein
MTAIRKRKRLRLTVVFGLLGVVVAAGIAGATHVRPKGASPLRVSLTPAFTECTSPNRTHGPPLAVPSCAPPVQTSNYLTVGTPDANGAPAKSTGHVLIRVASDGSNIFTTGEITDVRCRPGTNADVCNSPNGNDGPDYSGQLGGEIIVRATDHYNGPNQDETATVQDIPNPITFHCFNTADTSVGGTCRIPTEQPLIPQPYWFEGKRVVLEMTQVKVGDGGADGNPFTQPEQNTLFAVQGIFIP